MKLIYLETHRALSETEKALLTEGTTVIVYGYFNGSEACNAKLICKEPVLIQKCVRLEPPRQGQAQFQVELLEATPGPDGTLLPIGTMCLIHNIFVEK